MANSTKSHNPKASASSEEAEAWSAVGPFEAMQTLLAYQQQALDYASITTEALRLVTAQAQTQMDYLQALSQCRDIMGLAKLNLEFGRRFTETAASRIEEISHQSEKWLARADRMGPSPARHGMH